MRKLILYLLIIVCSGLQALISQTVTGTVTSAQDGLTIPGVTVRLKNSTTGTNTDNNGYYSIELPSLEGTLVFSFVGMKTVEVPIDGNTTIDAEMMVSIINLDEVMVVAYGTQKKITFTGAASTVKREKLEKIQATSITQMLQGTASGIQVVNPNGQPGNEPVIRIRGFSSINGNMDPLIVVDGAPFGGSINAIDPNNVESVTVLKDAAATALYGARASGGVIVITSKSGSGIAGTAKVDFKATYGVSQQATGLTPRLNNRDYYEVRWEAIRNGYMDANPAAPISTANQYAHNNLLVILGYNAFDKYPLTADGKFDETANPLWTDTWEDILFQPGPRQEYHLSMSGTSNDDLNYYISFGYLEDKGDMTFAQFQRYSARISVSKRVNKWFETGLSASFNRGISKAPSAVRTLRYTLDMPDIYPAWVWDIAANDYFRDAEGNKVWDMGLGNNNGWRRGTWTDTSPLAEADAKTNQLFNDQDNLSTRGFVNLTLLPGLQFKNSLSADYGAYASYTFWSNVWSWAAASGGRSNRSKTRDLTLNLTNLLTYEKTMGEHKINLLAGHETYALNTNFVSGGSMDFPPGISTLYEVNAGATITGAGSDENNHRIESYLSRVEYSLLERYYVSASYRRDGTSRFSSDYRWGNFWSVGASWRISEETFMTGMSGWLNNMSIRTSYGTQGNERIGGYYAYLGLYSLDSDIGNTAFHLSTLANPTLKWESQLMANLGVDMSIFDRINLSFEIFNKTSKDLLFFRELPLSSGMGGINENIGDIKNTGFELTLNSLNLSTPGGLVWQSEINMTHYKNVITNLPAKEISAGMFRYIEGVSIYDYYLRDWAGVDPVTGHSTYWKDNYELDGLGNPVLDANGDKIVISKEITGNLSEASFYYVGSALPDLIGNFSNTITYKGFDLNFNVYFSIGGQLYDTRYARLMHGGSRNKAETLSIDYLDRWTPENTDTDIPRVTTHSATGAPDRASSTYFLRDGTYARFRNISLGYSLPSSVTSRLQLSRIRIYFTADNAITFFKHKKDGLEPEQNFDGTVNASNMGVSSIISGGLQVSF